MAFLSARTWEKHANPWSGWSRTLAMPLLGASLYFHSWILFGITLVWLIINPLIFKKPTRTDNWMSQGVIGEQLYFKDGKKLKKDLPTLLNLSNIPLFALFVYEAWTQDIQGAVLLGILVMVIKFWFVDRMAQLARRQDNNTH